MRPRRGHSRHGDGDGVVEYLAEGCLLDSEDDVRVGKRGGGLGTSLGSMGDELLFRLDGYWKRDAGRCMRSVRGVRICWDNMFW